MSQSFRLEIQTTNAAFTTPKDEVERILRTVADRVKDDYTHGSVFDINGNHCGYWELS